MATKIVTKNSSTANAVPAASDLVQGELAVNVADKRLFTEDNGGSIVELGTKPSTIDINAGSIDGTAIGASSASTGAFTTLTATGAFTSRGIDDNADATAITIDSSENVGIGTSSPSAELEVSGGTQGVVITQSDSGRNAGYYAQIKAPHAETSFEINVNDNKLITAGGYMNATSLMFHTADTERMRIDSSGNVLVGTSSTSLTGTQGIQMFPADGGANKPRINIATAGSTSSEFPLSIWSTGVNAWRFYVQANGRISAVYTTITSLSDERVKENIRDLDDGLSKVMQLQPRKFDWKEGKGKNITNDRGFIAQEFEQVFPDLVNEWKDEAPEGEEPYKSVSADLIPTLVKAIQEQQTLIESLTARIAALEE